MQGLPTSNFAGVSSQVSEMAHLAPALGTDRCSCICVGCSLYNLDSVVGLCSVAMRASTEHSCPNGASLGQEDRFQLCKRARYMLREA